MDLNVHSLVGHIRTTASTDMALQTCILTHIQSLRGGDTQKKRKAEIEKKKE